LYHSHTALTRSGSLDLVSRLPLICRWNEAAKTSKQDGNSALLLFHLIISSTLFLHKTFRVLLYNSTLYSPLPPFIEHAVLSSTSSLTSLPLIRASHILTSRAWLLLWSTH